MGEKLGGFTRQEESWEGLQDGKKVGKVYKIIGKVWVKVVERGYRKWSRYVKETGLGKWIS